MSEGIQGAGSCASKGHVAGLRAAVRLVRAGLLSMV